MTSKKPSFVNFPRTNFLFNDGNLPKTVVKRQLLSEEQLRLCLAGPLIVEEKIDGSNSGLSFSEEGVLFFQGKTKYFEQNTHPQHHRFFNWGWTIRDALWDALGPNRILYGEWLFAKHTIKYTNLPAYFVGFDIYERPKSGGQEGWFWPVNDRDALFLSLGIATVPKITVGSFNRLEDLLSFADGPSLFGAPNKEGIYVRLENDDKLLIRAKYVRQEFRKEHKESKWSHKYVQEANLLKNEEIN